MGTSENDEQNSISSEISFSRSPFSPDHKGVLHLIEGLGTTEQVQDFTKGKRILARAQPPVFWYRLLFLMSRLLG